MLFSFPLGVPKAPLRPLGNDSSLPCLSPDLDGVQLFRIHCQAAAVVCVCAYVLGLLSFPLGVPKVPLRPLGNDRFLLCLSPDLDGVPLFRIHCQAAAVVRLCLRTGPLVFSCRRSKDVTSAPGERSFFALPEPGFRWCPAVSDPLPSGCRCAFVRSRLRHVFC